MIRRKEIPKSIVRRKKILQSMDRIKEILESMNRIKDIPESVNSAALSGSGHALCDENRYSKSIR